MGMLYLLVRRIQQHLLLTVRTRFLLGRIGMRLASTHRTGGFDLIFGHLSCVHTCHVSCIGGLKITRMG